MNYLLLSDYMWYFGHIFSGMSILFTHHNYYFAASLVIFGQFITIISRPIGRLKPKYENKIDPNLHPIEYII